MEYLLGIDIGGTKCAIIIGKHQDERLDIVDKVVFPTLVEKGVENTLNNIFGAIEKILGNNQLTTQDISAAGISCGSPMDSKQGLILSPPNLPGWDEIRIVEMIESKFDIKTKLQNDANACALGEWRFGAAKGYENVIFLTFGTGMGAGMILNGRIYEGTNGMAGEVGHIRLSGFGPVGYGKSGSFEGFCSGGGIAQLAKIKVREKLQMGEKVSFCNGFDELEKLNAKIVGDAAEAGDELAKEIYRISGEYLGQGLSVIIDVLNPQIIIIGSIFTRSTDIIWPHAKKIIDRECLDHTRKVCKVVPASLGESLGDFAALSVAIYEEGLI